MVLLRRYYPFLLTLILLGCATSTPTSRKNNFVSIYGKGGSLLQLQARVHNTAPDHSIIYYKLNTKDLLYKSDGSGGPFKAAVRITYESFTDWTARTLLDSSSTLIQDRSVDTNEDMELVGSMEMRRNENRSFVVKVTARDLNRDSENSVFLRVERDPSGTRQYFLPVDPATNIPYFTDHLSTGKVMELRNTAFAGGTLHGSHHSSEVSLPAPVFTTTNDPRSETKADSSFSVTFDENGRALLTLNEPGVYHLRNDTSSTAGYSIFVLSEAYPYISDGTDMLKPLRYITSMQEFDRISKADDVRRAIEKFWLDAAGDRERAREAIRIFYSRVENANRHFTSRTEGWRTDRGLVHIIFGTPTSIYKTDLNETWIYGEENNLMSLTFNFTKRNNTFTDNDLVLQRDPMLKGAWYRNVESWRNGRVYQN